MGIINLKKKKGEFHFYWHLCKAAVIYVVQILFSGRPGREENKLFTDGGNNRLTNLIHQML